MRGWLDRLPVGRQASPLRLFLLPTSSFPLLLYLAFYHLTFLYLVICGYFFAFAFHPVHPLILHILILTVVAFPFSLHTSYFTLLPVLARLLAIGPRILVLPRGLRVWGADSF